MRSKFYWAGACARTAVVVLTLVSALGSGAVASVVAPGQTEQVPNVAFVAHPVVQSLPGDAQAGDQVTSDDQNAATGTEVSSDDSAADDSADSLAELVADEVADSDTLTPDLRCLAGAVYFESRGETLEGQLAVARVIVNRANSHRFPPDYCGVVLQRSQFSFVRGGRLPHINENARTWRRAVAIARIAADDSWKSPAKGALFFHAARVSPRWRLTKLAQVDNHIFYR